MMRDLVDPAVVADLARGIAENDAAQFGHQYPAYAADIAHETQTAVDALRRDPLHEARYVQFLADMVYGERPAFAESMATVVRLIERWLPEG